LLTFKFV